MPAQHDVLAEGEHAWVVAETGREGHVHPGSQGADFALSSVRQQVTLTKPLYEKREKIIAQIPNFWPLVFEQAPPDIDEYIQPSDAALFLSALKSLSVSHFEIADGGKGDPRSLAIRFEFNENDHFEDAVLEKKFWHRRARDGWAGLVSEPVDIRWKEGKDLTGGLLRAVKENWAAEQQNGVPARGAEPTETQKRLDEKIESTGLGGGSFFLFFGFIGRRVSAEESRLATEKEAERAALRKAGKAVPEDDAEEDEEEDDYEDELSLEVCPDGDDLAVTIAEDLWPGAIKYFSTCIMIRTGPVT
ncbi:MAG: NAP domain-containing protein [Thaumarchaeota archaeon]|nr:NAP domain-containing protein [Nitrososphaerota archaeon]